MLMALFFLIFACRKIPKIVTNSDEPYVKIGKETYLTLETLAAILEKLSESGKCSSFVMVKLKYCVFLFRVTVKKCLEFPYQERNARF
jgi:hypothetical protein